MISPAQQSGLRAETVARQSYGRLLAMLASRSGDVALAEDALADAFRQALEIWPQRGIPANAEAWLLTVARNRSRDIYKSMSVKTGVSLEHTDVFTLFVPERDVEAIPDERLKLMFVCTHPAIDVSMRTPLMLQTVLGLEAAQIAPAFLVPPATMAQRLVRVKRKIKDARIPFVVPERADLPSRLEAVLEAIYAAYSIGWDAVAPSLEDLGREALFLADLTASFLPNQPEALGLAALIAHSEARRAARASPEGIFIPLDQQNCANWDMQLIDYAEKLLFAASQLGQIGRFQLEAAIQSAHACRARNGKTDWNAIALLYEGLVQLTPGIGAAVGRAVAIGQSQGASAGLVCLDLIAPEAIATYQPAWAARAHLLKLAQRFEESRKAYARAIALTPDFRLRIYLQAEMRKLSN